jgi:D-alanyl-D-alanine carboxypeptidase
MFRKVSLGAAALATLTGLTLATPQAVAEKTNPVQQGLSSLVTDHDFPAAMASVREANGRSRFYSAGKGNLATNAPVPTESQIRIASSTKMFVSAVVLQLVGEGKIGLDEPIETYLPGLIRGEGIDGHDITVRQVLQHTSGLPEYFTVDYKDIRHQYVEPRQLLDRALAQPATFAPGTSWRYSNTNYVVAGLIVQRVTGRPIAEQITTRVIKPLGLKHTYWPGIGEEGIRENHAHGYYTPTRDDFTVMDPSWGWAAGQMIATPGDINKFLAALVGGKVLKPAQLAEMRKTVAAPGFPPGWQYGLGLMRITLSCDKIAWGHGGDIDGYENRNGVTEDGRAATVAVTALPTPEQGPQMLTDHVLDTALCR